MRSLLTLLLLLVSFSVSQSTPPPASQLIVDETAIFDAVAAASVGALPAPYPLQCGNREYEFQIIWVVEEGGTIPPDGQAILGPVAERVNGLFWRDSNDWRRGVVPAWAVDDHCQLNIIYVPRGTDFLLAPKTKYIVVEPAERSYCGVATVFNDNRPGPENDNNRSAMAWISGYCLREYYPWAHEMVHLMGGVHPEAPRGNGGWHSNEFDLMGPPTLNRCDRHDQIDCGYDDYFSLNPVPGSYLVDHWNIANSPYLIQIARYPIWFPLVHTQP